MKALIQRVKRASVSVDGERVSEIGKGLLVFLGIMKGDTPTNASRLAEKISGLRIFDDGRGKMNLSALDLNLEILVVSQFTLAADTRRGRRPSFADAAPPEEAEELCERFAAFLETNLKVARGRFRAMMDVELVNDGPVTIMLEDPSRGEA
ncbi:MAG: D-tyrosyl-tRNA(Tyr) deacylase [Deltaproteobacteria bacterium]|jgi:D-tyrosyl-tRNA(Tyr) deacylase|nr:D-tyrosyl-tRNA(Tyr) deacylase [Deltaproteobacteria bacterium]